MMKPIHTLQCSTCGRSYATTNPNLIPRLCGPCDEAEGKRQMETHLRNYGPPAQRSEAQKKREPF